MSSLSTSCLRYVRSLGFCFRVSESRSSYSDLWHFDGNVQELQSACSSGGYGGFLPAVKQIANVAALPGIVHKSIGLPDVHSGYGFAIGNVAAFGKRSEAGFASLHLGMLTSVAF